MTTGQTVGRAPKRGRPNPHFWLEVVICLGFGGAITLLSLAIAFGVTAVM